MSRISQQVLHNPFQSRWGRKDDELLILRRHKVPHNAVFISFGAPCPQPLNTFQDKSLWSTDMPHMALGAQVIIFQKVADVWKKAVWNFQAFSQTFFELRFSLGNEGRDSKILNSQTWLGSPRRPSPRHPQDRAEI